MKGDSLSPGGASEIPRINPGTNRPQTKQDLMGYRLHELHALAKDCRVPYTGLNKDALAARIADYLSQPFTHRKTIVVSR